MHSFRESENQKMHKQMYLYNTHIMLIERSNRIDLSFVSSSLEIIYFSSRLKVFYYGFHVELGQGYENNHNKLYIDA